MRFLLADHELDPAAALAAAVTPRGRLFYWVANWNLSRAHAALLLAGAAAAAKTHVVDMIDCTHAGLPHVLEALRAPGGPRRVGGYVTGSRDILWTAQDFASIPHGVAILSIDQSNSNLELLGKRSGFAKDDEPGASSNATAARVAAERIRAGDDETIYVDAANLAGLEHAIAAEGLPPGQIVAYQWASPTSNPNTLLPGTNRTLREADADLSVILASILPLPSVPPAPAPRPPVAPAPAADHHLARARVTTDVELDLHTLGWRHLGSDVKPLAWGD